jgi:hypothetical protein
VVRCDRKYLGEDPLRLFKIFQCFFVFFIIKYRNVAVRGKLMEIATFLPTAAGQFYLLSYWLAVGIWPFPSGFPIIFKNCPEAFQQPLGISQRLSYTL